MSKAGDPRGASGDAAKDASAEGRGSVIGAVRVGVHKEKNPFAGAVVKESVTLKAWGAGWPRRTALRALDRACRSFLRRTAGQSE